MCNKEENSELIADVITEVDSELMPSASEEVVEETIEEVAEEVPEKVDVETNSEKDSEEGGVYSLDKCLNCGTELNGIYCHNCGQHVTDHKMTVKRFILNYLDNAFLWDSHHLKTIWLLISRPGLLTNEYIAGKFVSQVQPLKLNMFLLFVFLTLFVFFASDQHIDDKMQEVISNEIVFASLQMDEISSDEAYLEKIKASPCDTVRILAPLSIAKNHPTIIKSHKVIYDTEGKSLDQWIAIIPHVFIEEKILKLDDEGCYRFNTEVGVAVEDIEMFRALWKEMSEFSLQYFPVIMLLTAPFLAFSLRLVQRKRKRTYFTHFIFSMHYIAFVDLMVIVMYLFYLVAHPSFTLLNIIFTVFSCIYFARAFHAVYETSWFRSITKAILSNVIYYIICLSAFMAVFIIACVIVALQMPDSYVQ